MLMMQFPYAPAFCLVEINYSCVNFICLNYVLPVILTSLVSLCHRNCLSNQDEHEQEEGGLERFGTPWPNTPSPERSHAPLNAKHLGGLVPVTQTGVQQNQIP